MGLRTGLRIMLHLGPGVELDMEQKLDMGQIMKL